MTPGSARMVVLAWCGHVWAVVAGWAAEFGCCTTVVMVGAGGGGAVVVPRGSGRGVVRCGLTRAPVGPSRPAGGRAGGPPDLFWSSWPRWVPAAGEPPCPRRGDGERACQRCASRRRASRPRT